ncbi:MnmC family methyltransferase [Vampirovibrio sp.]|uniref:MnmC family methyltransferase n=1 Tax=Vampirovibrio sp. TaxID=2717857 RepID=UPI003594003D
MPFQIMPTDDGSLSCLDLETGQLSHNSAGAYTEAFQNYVRPSLLLEKPEKADQIRVLDVCYGMGYNSWALINEILKQGLTCQHPTRPPFTISITAIEKHLEAVQFLPHVLKHPTFDALRTFLAPSEHNIYYRTLTDTNDTKEELTNPRRFMMTVAGWLRLDITLWLDDLRCRVPQLQEDFDAIFHDPFSPQKMPELWTQDLFQHYHRLLIEKQGVLLTYSTAAAVRGGLSAAGFHVLKTPGLGRKAGSTLALTTPLTVASDFTLPLAAWEAEYIQSRAGIPYRDEGLQQSRSHILQQRLMAQENSARPSGAKALKQKPIYDPHT